MSRNATIKKRNIKADPKYNSQIVAKFINTVMLDGKKSLAEKIVYNSFDIISSKIIDKTPIEIFNKAIENAKLQVELKTRRIGGANYQVPTELSEERKITLAIRWIVSFSRKSKVSHNAKDMSHKLANEIIDAFNGIGSSIKKRDEIHRMAEANKAFAHYKW